MKKSSRDWGKSFYPQEEHCPSLSLLVRELSPSNLQESWVWGFLVAFIWLNSPVTSHILRVESRFPFSRTGDLGPRLWISLYILTQLPAFLGMGGLFAVGSLRWCLSPSCICALEYLSLPYSLLQFSEGWCRASVPGGLRVLQKVLSPPALSPADSSHCLWRPQRRSFWCPVSM